METYTQGLMVSGGMRIRRERRLPVPGEVRVEKGQRVESETILASAELPGKAEVVNVAGTLGISPGDVERCALVREGDRIERGGVLARSAGFLGLFKTSCASPLSGRVESVSAVTGQLILRGEPLPVDVTAYLGGEVVEVFPGEGAAVETVGAFVQGIFGVGGEAWGPVCVRTQDGQECLDASGLDESCRGGIVVGGRGLSPGCVERAAALGIRGLVVGSITDRDLRALLGYDLGSAITGSEAVPATLVITEGFGDLAMADATFEVLQSCDGRSGSIHGKTQIRAGVIRPEVVVPTIAGAGMAAPRPEVRGTLGVGVRVRGAREPFFGRVGRVTELPEEPVKLETEAEVRVVRVVFEDGREALVPRNNVEAI